MILVTGLVLFAAQSGALDRFRDAQAAHAGTEIAEERTLVSSSRPEGAGPILPQIVVSSDVRLPMAAEPIAPEALTAPTGFPDAAPDVPNAPLTEATELSPLGLPCDVTVSASPMPAAMVALDVMAPCRAEAAVEIAHAGLLLTARTDALGLLTLDIPAFETPAFFSVTFGDGTEETVLVGLPDLRDYDRIGLGWQGNMGLELHAMEFGAAFGDDGHVWQESPASPDAAMDGSGGFLSVIEAGESFAQIYTLPRATLREGDSVRLSIDAPVTEANCTRDVVARTLRAEGGGPVDVRELTFTVPSCDAVGDVLVLQNLLDDLRLASN
ncbi:hypothetical protein [Hasllibacter sp. MH4015]|uniref:hypothetical protein n=1 Tax=Hasllibacter sp. MH4015 TaxID=2854029 RepID=UPI001CD5D829|nr:hypothetical protein [Hasllibacter sp. MH4015]